MVCRVTIECGLCLGRMDTLQGRRLMDKMKKGNMDYTANERRHLSENVSGWVTDQKATTKKADGRCTVSRLRMDATVFDSEVLGWRGRNG